jgi:hypothetical protein
LAEARDPNLEDHGHRGPLTSLGRSRSVDQTPPSPSLGPPLLSASLSPPLPCGMPFECGVGAAWLGAGGGGGGGAVTEGACAGGSGGGVIAVMVDGGAAGAEDACGIGADAAGWCAVLRAALIVDAPVAPPAVTAATLIPAATTAAPRPPIASLLFVIRSPHCYATARRSCRPALGDGRVYGSNRPRDHLVVGLLRREPHGNPKVFLRATTAGALWRGHSSEAERHDEQPEDRSVRSPLRVRCAGYDDPGLV